MRERDLGSFRFAFHTGWRFFRLLLVLLLIILLPACTGRRGQQLGDIPTPASFEGLATAQFLTQNAPPPGFRGPVAFPEVDANLNDLAGWHYIVHLEFEGVFARTPRETSASANAEVWSRQVGSAKRVLVQTVGELLGPENNAFEAVRLGPDAFLVRQNTCIQGADAGTGADLRAGTLVGGVRQAVPSGRKATINGQEAWEYTFTAADLSLPSIRLSDEGQITLTGGELWIAPEYNTVIRFYVNLDVANAIIFDRQLPVTGQLILRYDLYDIDVTPNITVPFGC